MAIKNNSSTALFFVQDVSTGLGVTGLTSGNFSSVKLAQDNVLSTELQPITVSGYGGGYYGFATTAGQMNYNCILPIVISSGNYQPYGIAMYTELGYLPANSGILATNASTINTISGNLNTVNNTLNTVSGNVNTVSTNITTLTNNVATTSGNVTTIQNNLITVSGNLNTTNNTLNTVSGNLLTVQNNLTTVSGNIALLPTVSTIITSGNAAGWQTFIRDLNQCQAGAAGTVTLDTNASAVDNAYQGYTVVLASGTGAGQTRYINSYVGSTKVATISPNWATNPAATTMYRIVQTNSNVAGNTTGAVTLVTTTTTATTATTATNLTNWPATAIPATATAPIATAVALSGNAAGWRAGYEDGNVWLDTVNGVAGTVLYVNGIVSSPTNLIASAFTIATALKTTKIRNSNNSVLVPAATLANYELLGENYALDLNNQAIANTILRGALVSGLSTGQGANIYNSQVGNITIDSCWIYDSVFTGTLTTVASGIYVFKDCSDGIAGDPNPTVIMKPNVIMGIRNYRGGINISGMGSSNNLVVDGDCRVVLGADCSGGTVKWRGFLGIDDQVVGGFSGVVTQSERYNIPYLASNIVTSGNAAGWNNSAQITALSGQLANVDVNIVGVSGLLQNVDNEIDFLSGIINTINNTTITTSGNVSNLPTITTIVASGTAAGWAADTNPVTVSGFTPASLTQVVISGNAANWNSVTSVDLSGISGSLNTISGNLNRTENTLITVSGKVNNLPLIGEIVSSGNTAGWNATTAITSVTVSGYTPGALTQIVTSGNAAGWAAVTPATDLSGISGTLATISGNLTTVSGLVNALPTITTIVASGNAASWNDVTNLSGISGSLNTISGNLLRVENTLITVSGKVNAIPTTDVSSDVTSIKNTVQSVTYGNSALLTAVQNVQNNTFIAATIPALLERPDAGSVIVSITVVFSDETGTAKNLDAGNPGTTLVNDLGTDLSSRLGAWTNPATGKYVISYTNTSTDTLEGLHWEITGTINGKLRRYPGYTQLVDTTAVDFTSTDRAMLTQVQNNLITVSGVVRTTDNTVITISGNLNTTSTDVTQIKNNVVIVSGNLLTVQNNLSTVSGNLTVLDNVVDTVSGNLLRTENTLITVSGKVNALPLIGEIVTSGNVAGWNSVTSIVNVTVSGFTPGALGQIVTSGNAANWNADTNPVTVSGFTPGSLSQIVVSGHADGWATVTPVTDLSGISGSLTTISGNLRRTENTLITVSGDLNIANLGIAATYGKTVTISGNIATLNDVSIGEIVASGNAANWNSVTSVDLSGISGQLINISGSVNALSGQMTAENSIILANVSGVQNSLNAVSGVPVTVSGITPSALSQIVVSGTAAGWATDDVYVEVSGVSSAALAEIVSGVFNYQMPELTTLPSATPTLGEAEMLKYMQLRNPSIQEDPTLTGKHSYIYNDAGSGVFKTPIYDDPISGIFIKGKIEIV